MCSQLPTKTKPPATVESVTIIDDSSTKCIRSDAKAAQNQGIDVQGMANNYDYVHSPFYEALSPLITCLKYSGLYFEIHKNRTISLQRVYCYILCLVPFVALILLATLFRFISSINDDFMKTLACFSFSILCAANAVSFLKHSHNARYVRNFFRGFENLNKYGGPFTQSGQVNKMAKYAVIIFCIGYLIGVGFIIYAVCLTEYFYVILRGFGMKPTNPIIKTAMTIFVTLLGLQWIFPNCVELCFSILIYMEYKKFYKAFRAGMHVDPGQFKKLIETDRQRFVEMAHIVEAADKILAIHHGASFASNIVSLCLILYIIAYYLNVTQVSFIIAYSLMCLADISVVCFSGILIHTSVRLRIILYINKVKA